MLQLHTITKDNLIEEKVNNRWTNDDMTVIKDITNVWIDNNIAISVLLFFKTGLYAYMPIVSRYKTHIPEVKDYKIEGKEAKIIGVDPYKISSASLRPIDVTTIAGIMADYLWYGNQAFSLVRINIMPFARESTMTTEIPTDRGVRRLRGNQLRSYCQTRRNQLLRRKRQRIRKKLRKRIIMRKRDAKEIVK